jgi:hypothetical protein
MGQVERRHGLDSRVCLDDRQRRGRIGRGRQLDLGVDRQVREGSPGDRCARSRAEEQDTRDERRCDRNPDEGGERTARLPDDEVDRVADEDGPATSVRRWPSRIS